MASIRKMRDKYYARVRWYLTNGKREETLIPLKTASLTTARTRLKLVENQETDIKNQIIQKFQFKDIFQWLNDAGTSRFTSMKLVDIIPDYLEYRKCVVRKSTVDRDRVSLKQLTDFIGENKPVEELSYKDIEGVNGLIQHLRNKPNKDKQGYADSGINITLRHLSVFFSYLLKEKLIPEPIEFNMIKEGEKPFYYFNESELKAIYEYDGLAPFFKRCFYFYEQTGMRASEPFRGELIGDWFIVGADCSKGKNVRQIPLSPELQAILKEMHQFRDTINTGSKNHKKMRKATSPTSKSSIRPYPPYSSAYTRIAKRLEMVVKALGFKGKELTIKGLRATYGIRRVTVTGDIFQVAREMGHRSVTTTEKHYLRFPLERRLADFPSLAKHIEKTENMPVIANKGYESRDTRAYLIASS